MYMHYVCFPAAGVLDERWGVLDERWGARVWGVGKLRVRQRHAQAMEQAGTKTCMTKYNVLRVCPLLAARTAYIADSRWLRYRWNHQMQGVDFHVATRLMSALVTVSVANIPANIPDVCAKWTRAQLVAPAVRARLPAGRRPSNSKSWLNMRAHLRAGSSRSCAIGRDTLEHALVGCPAHSQSRLCWYFSTSGSVPRTLQHFVQH